MATDKFYSLLTMAILFSVFTLFVGMFAIGLGGQYGLDTTGMQGGQYNLSALNNTLDLVSSKSVEYKDQFTQQSFLSTAGFIVVNGIFDITILMWNFIITPFQVLTQLIAYNFAPSDNPAIINTIAGVITFILIVTMIFGIWSLIKKGD